LLLGTVDSPFGMQCLNNNGVFPFSLKFQILAVESPEPEASKSCTGFHEQMNTSDSCPLRTVTLLEGISIVPIELSNDDEDEDTVMLAAAVAADVEV